jgi:hypothetical protein
MHLQIEEQEATRTVLNVAGQPVAVLCRITTVCPAVVDYKALNEHGISVTGGPPAYDLDR